MKRSKVLVTLLSVMTMLLSACGGGGSGSTSTGGHYYTHSELAQEFVRRVNSDVAGYDLELVKINTLQSDYIVVYDWVYGTYDAYYIGSYNVGENLSDYLYSYQDYFYYGLWYDDVFNEYVDPYSNVRFEKKAASGKNLAKLNAFKADITIQKNAEKLRANYGLSEVKSLEASRMAYNIKNAAAGSITNADIDRAATSLVGSSVSDFQQDFMSGNAANLNSRIERAAIETGMGIENTQALIKDMFLK